MPPDDQGFSPLTPPQGQRQPTEEELRWAAAAKAITIKPDPEQQAARAERQTKLIAVSHRVRELLGETMEDGTVERGILTVDQIEQVQNAQIEKTGRAFLLQLVLRLAWKEIADGVKTEPKDLVGALLQTLEAQPGEYATKGLQR